MKLDDVFSQWGVDGNIDLLNLSEELLCRPKLHGKWMRYYVDESFLLKKHKTEMDRMIKFKTNYYLGKLDDDQLAKFGWEPYRLTILKSDVQMYLDSDQDIVDLKLKIELQEKKVYVIEQIVKQIGYRANDIKALMDYEKFKSGS